MPPFSTATISALTDVITGGPGGMGRRVEVPGKYRRGPEIEQFFGNLNIDIVIGSRVPSVREKLIEINTADDGEEPIKAVINAVVDPREYFGDPEALDEVVEHLNKRLVLDGFEIREVGPRPRLVALGTNAPVAAALHDAADELDFDSVKADFDRALEAADTDPADAITAACSTVESVCKSLLDEMGADYPAKQDIQGLTRELARHLDLLPGQAAKPGEGDAEIRGMLQGLASCAQNIGALRTKAGDAHGRGKYTIAADARTARLAIHAASTISLFYIETWQQMDDGDT